MSYLAEFCDLPGVRKGRRRGPIVGSVSGFLTAMRSHEAATAAGDHGAITVWRDDAGMLRAAFSRHRVVIDTHTFATQAALRGWLGDWMPKMREPS